MVRLRNTGTAPLDFLSVTKNGGPLGNVRFSFSTTTAPFTLQPNTDYDIQVTYTPVIERPSNQPDTGSIVFGNVAGVFGGPSSITVQIWSTRYVVGSQTAINKKSGCGDVTVTRTRLYVDGRTDEDKFKANYNCNPPSH